MLTFLPSANYCIIHTFSYKNNFIRTTRLKFAKNNRGSASDANVTASFMEKHKSQHIASGLSNSAVIETLSEQRRKSTVPHVFYDSAEVYIRQ